MKLPVLILTLLPWFTAAQPCREVTGYFPSWKWYHRNKLVNPASIDYSKYTVINYAFFQPNPDGSISTFDPIADKTLLLGEIKPSAPPGYGKWKGFGDRNWHIPGTSLVERAHQRGVKVLISVGGWTLTQHFPAIAADKNKRQRFASSCADLVRVYGIDGIDLDWEYPGYPGNGGSPADKRNFTLLLEAVRDSLDALGQKPYRPLLLTAAFGAAPARMAEIEWQRVTPLLDYVNLMTYDFYGSNYSVTNHNSPLFSPEKGLAGFDLHSVVRHLMDTYSVPSRKINIGLAFYGRSLKTKGDPGLHTASNRTPDTATFPEDAGAPMFYNILARQNLFNYQWDSLAQTPYLKGKSSLHTFVSFDDELSIAHKAKYILDHQLAGAIIWDITGDYVESPRGSGTVSRTPLANALMATLCSYLYVFEEKTVPGYLPYRRPLVEHKTYPPRLVYGKPALTKKELRQQKRKLKKERKQKNGAPERYFNGGW